MAGGTDSSWNGTEVGGLAPLNVPGDPFATGAALPGAAVETQAGLDWCCTARAQQQICEAKISLIRELELLQPGWDGKGAAPIHPGASQALALVLRAVDRRCPRLRLGAWEYVQAGPRPDGGLWLAWRVDDWEWTGQVEPDGRLWRVAAGTGVDTPDEAWEEGILCHALIVAQLVDRLKEESE